MDPTKNQHSKTLDISLIVFAILAILICIQSYTMSIGTLSHPESGFFPFILGALLLIFSGIKLLVDLHANGALRFLKPDMPAKRIIPVLFILFAYVFALDVLGFILSTILLVFLLIRIIETKAWWVGALVALGTTTLCYLVFQVWLRVQLPMGMLWGD